MPREKLFNRERVAPAHFFQRNEPAVHGNDDFGFAPRDPARRTGRR